MIKNANAIFNEKKKRKKKQHVGISGMNIFKKNDQGFTWRKCLNFHKIFHISTSFLLCFQGIQITATTPTSNAVRLETGSIELELSNRVQTASKEGAASKLAAPKVFVKAQVGVCPFSPLGCDQISFL